MSAIDRVKIVVLGDSGVGKTSFVNLAAHGEPIKSPSWTVGCSVEVKLHEYKEGTKDQKTYFIEFWDVGGSNNHRNARHVFYYPCHGIILVHDLSNRKSQDNLQKWIQELVSHNANAPLVSVTTGQGDFDTENFMGSSQLPVLIIGTKLDLVDDRKVQHSTFAAQFGADEILLDCRQARHLAAGTSNAVKLSRFFDKVIEMRYYSPSKSRSFHERFGSNAVSPVLPTKFYSPHQD